MRNLSVILLVFNAGCATYTYDPPPTQYTASKTQYTASQPTQDFTQTTHNVVRINNSLAELVSSSYPLFYAISVLAR